MPSTRKAPVRGIVPTQFLALSAAIVAVVIALVAGLSYGAVQTIEEEATERNLILIGQTRDLIDAHLGQIDRIATRLGRSSATVAFLSMGPLETGSPELDKVIQAANEIQEYRIQNDFVRAVYLYARRSGIILSSDSTYLRPETEYAYCIGYGGLPYADFKARFLGGPARMAFAPAAPMRFGGSSLPVVLCSNALPIGASAGGLGVALAAIDEARLKEFLGRLVGSGEGAAFVADASGRLLSSTGSPEALEIARGLPPAEPGGLLRVSRGGSEWLVSRARSLDYGLSFVSIQPRAVFFERIGYLRKAALAMGILFALLGLGLAYLLARRSAKPLFEIAWALEGGRAGDRAAGRRSAPPPGGQGIVHRVKNDIGRLLEAKEELEAAFERRLPVLRHTVLRDLLEGSLRDEELEALLDDARLPVAGGAAYAACSASFAGSTERRMRNVAFEEALAGAFPGRAFACEAGEGAVAVLFRLEAGEAGGFDASLRAFHASLAEAPGLAVLMASGGVVATLGEVPVSYGASRRLLEFSRGFIGGAGSERSHSLVDASCLSGLPLAYAYPIDLETRVIATVKAGKVEALEEALERLEASLRAGDGQDERPVLNGLEGTLLRLLGDLPRVEGLPLPLPEERKPRLEALLACFRRLAEARAAEFAGDEGDLKAGLAAYIAERYADPGLNLYQVSKDFGKKESYLYGFWKEGMGESFAAALERRRMEAAIELLEEGASSVDDIARRVGYNSSHSFRRAFKRRYGVAPAEFKASAPE